jgi:hypothetical protein
MNIVKKEIGTPIQVDDDLALKMCQQKYTKSKTKPCKKRKGSSLAHSGKSTTTATSFTEEKEEEEDFKITLAPTNENYNNMSTDHIIDNLNSGDSWLNNPKRLERIENAYKYLKNLVHKLKLPSLNNIDYYSFNGCYELLYNRDSSYYEPFLVNGWKHYKSSSKLDPSAQYESLSVVTEPNKGNVKERVDDEFCIKLIQCQWDNTSYYSDLNESEGYDSDELSIITDDEY